MAASGGDASTFHDLVELAKTYLTPAALVAMVGLVWRGSAKTTAFAKTQDDHDEQLAEHQNAIDALKAADAQQRVAIAALPTRDDVRDLREEVARRAAETQMQMQNGFDNLTRVMTMRGD
jgi:membrane-bound lytic murein transglycosylase